MQRALLHLLVLMIRVLDPQLKSVITRLNCEWLNADGKLTERGQRPVY